MLETRRDFLRALGIVIASTLSGCMSTCYTPALPATPDGSGDWDRLREPWLDLDLLARDAKDMARGEATRARLVTEHRTALDRLVASGSLDEAVAEDLQIAFEGAAMHAWRLNAPITCYTPSLTPDYAIESRVQLAAQAQALSEMAEKAEIAPDTVALARAAIERDLAFLALTSQDQQALTRKVVEEAGTTNRFPALDALGLHVPDECAVAAQVLVDLLLDRK